MLRRVVLAILLLAAAGPCVAQVSYPGKSIRFVVPYPPGGLTDVLARITGQKLTESWGQPVLVENRGGGGSTIGSDIVAKLSAEIGRILRLPEVSERLSSQGAEIAANTPEQFAAFIRAEIGKWAKVVKDSGARVD